MSPEVFEQGMAELSCHAVASSEETAERKAIRSRMWAEELSVLNDHQFHYAVREWARTDGKGFLPTVGKLLELGYAAPPPEKPPSRALLAAPDPNECPACEGTGFEPYEQSGYRWVRHCLRGCTPLRSGERRTAPWSHEWSPKSTTPEWYGK